MNKLSIKPIFVKLSYQGILFKYTSQLRYEMKILLNVIRRIEKTGEL